MLSSARDNNKITCANCGFVCDCDCCFCDFCGNILNLNDFLIECETHPQNHSIGICTVCNKPVCWQCAVKNGKIILCNSPDHLSIFNEYKIIYRPESEFEAEAIISNLNNSCIEAKMFSLHDYISTNELKQKRILVFVKDAEWDKAKTLLLDLNLIQ